jgi:MFS family permease
MILSLFTGGITSSITSLIPLYVVDVHHGSEVSAAMYFTIYASAGIWASPLGGYLSDRLGRVPLIVVSSLLAGVIIYLINVVPAGFGLGSMMLLLGAMNFIRMPVSEAYIIGQTTERNRSTVYGIYYFSMTETSAVFAPIMGYLSDNWGFENSFTWASLATLGIIIVCSFFLRGSRN